MHITTFKSRNDGKHAQQQQQIITIMPRMREESRNWQFIMGEKSTPKKQERAQAKEETRMVLW